MKGFHIIGTGSQLKYVVENIRNELEIKGILDINEKIDTNIRRGIIAIGGLHKKKELVNILSERGFEFIMSINSRAYVSEDVEIGEGTIIHANATIMSGTKIGKHCVVGAGSVAISNILHNTKFKGVPAK